MTDHLAVETLSACLDQALSPEALAGAQAHLAVCEHCQRELRALTRVNALLRDQPGYPVPPFFSARVAALVRERQTPRFATDFLWVFKRLAPGFALVLAALAAWTLSHPTPETASLDDFASTAATTEISILAQNASELTTDEVLQLVVYTSAAGN